MRRKRRWSELSPRQRTGIVAAAAVQLVLFAAAQRDIGGREPERVRGPKPLWRVVCFVNFIGPVAWFAAGRRP